MNRFLCLLSCGAFLFSLPVAASADEGLVRELEVSRQGDLELGCGALSREAILMRDIISVTQDIQDTKELENHGINAVGAVGGLLVGTATGGLGLAAAGLLATEVNDASSDEAEGVQDIAEQRRSFIIGIFNAKGCEGPIENAMQNIELDFPNIAPAAGETRHASAGADTYNN